MIQNSLDSLDEKFLENYVQPFLAELMQRRIYVAVVETRRSRERQKMLYGAGKTETADRSLHLTGEAIDIVPVTFYDGKVRKPVTLYGGKVCEATWDASNPVWDKIADVAALFGLEWGGDWGGLPDYVHFQSPEPRRNPTLAYALGHSVPVSAALG